MALGTKARQFSKHRQTYKDVLSESQAVEMEKFLITLTIGYRECKQAGIKPDVLAAMNAWGNIPKTKEDHAVTVGFNQRERKMRSEKATQRS